MSSLDFSLYLFEYIFLSSIIMLLIMEYFFYIISILCTASFYTVVIKLISIIAIYLWKYLQSWNKNDGNFNCPQMLSFLTHYIIIFIINNIIRAKNATIINSRDHRHNKTHSIILLTFFFNSISFAIVAQIMMEYFY